MYVCVRAYSCHSANMEVRRQPNFQESLTSWSTICVTEIELRLSGLVVSALAHWTILLAPFDFISDVTSQSFVKY